jgi:transcriptional regulator with XRE-family HTH domain
MLLATQQTSSPFSYAQSVKTGHPELRRTVAANLRALMDKRDWSQMDLQGKCKVSQRHISNMLNQKTSASFETLEAVAHAFGIPGWTLLIDRLPADLLDSQKLPLLVANYRDAGPDGKALLERLADREAEHNRAQPKVSPLRKTTTG